MPDGLARNGRRLSVLLLCDDHPSHATTLLEHIAAFQRFSRHDVKIFNPRGLRRCGVLDLDEFDVIVIHYSLIVISDHYLAPPFRKRLAEFHGLKVQYIQDDYRQVDEISAMIRNLGIDVLFTLVPERELQNVWGNRLPDVQTTTTLAGYVSEDAIRHPTPPTAARTVDVGYRGRTLPYWLGILGQEKAWIAQGFMEHAASTRLLCDIGWRESDRIYGRSWFGFISSCRATLGTESGSTITDFDGTLQRRVERYVGTHPGVGFWEVHRKLLEPFEGNVRMNVISPRIFEAITLRTALVLFPGEYSGVVEPERHYICLEKDFSNFDEVVMRLQDNNYLEALTQRAYEEIVTNEDYSFRGMIREFDYIVAARVVRRSRSSLKFRYRLAVAEHGYHDSDAPGMRSRSKVPAGARRIVATARVLTPDREVLRYGSRRLRFRSVERGRLLDDLLRLALLRRVQSRSLSTRDAFVVSPTVEGRVLTLRSVTPESGVPSSVATIVERIRGGQIDRVQWDHSTFGSRFDLPVDRAHWVTFPVSADDDGAVHRFAALDDLVATERAPLAVLLERALAPPLGGAMRPTLPLPLHVVCHFDHYAQRTLSTVRVLSASSNLRRVLFVALRDGALGDGIGPRVLLGELVKLRLLGDARRKPARGDVRTIPTLLSDGTLIFRTTPRPGEKEHVVALDEVVPEQVRRVVWDHSELGGFVSLGNRGSREADYELGPHGEFEFVAVTRLLQRKPELTWRAVVDP